MPGFNYDPRMPREMLDLIGMEKFTYKKIYDTRESPNGKFSAREFHSKCDGKGPTLIITQILVPDSGRRMCIGAYTESSWSSDKTYSGLVRRMVCLIFPEIYVVLPARADAQKVHNNDPNHGPCFGNHELCIPSKVGVKTGGCFNLGETFGDSARKDDAQGIQAVKQLLGGSNKAWAITGYAVFTVTQTDKFGRVINK